MKYTDELLKRAMQKVTDIFYREIYFVDLSGKQFVVLKKENLKLKKDCEKVKMENAVTLADFILKNSLCHPSDEERLKESLQIENLKGLFLNNENKPIQIKYREKYSKRDDKYHFVTLVFVPGLDEDGHQIVFIFLRDLEDNDEFSQTMVTQFETDAEGVERYTISVKKTILIVEDDKFNRELLRDILKDQYNIYEATNGQEALDILELHEREINLVVLDIIMPVLDGYKFLEIRKQKKKYAHIPVIVITGMNKIEDEAKCLQLGAVDFITKPFNDRLVNMRINGVIKMCETSAILTELEYDSLTGLLTQRAFYHYAEQYISMNPNGDFEVVYMNIENFKYINEKYGEDKGDELLQYIGTSIMNISNEAICARHGADHFVGIIPVSNKYDNHYLNSIIKGMVKNSPIPSVSVKVGVYKEVDNSLPISVLCDRAKLAASSIKEVYGETIAYYDEEINNRMKREQQIVECMEKALEEHQFSVYYQPKHNVSTGKLSGAEALVRWIHPEMGFMAPYEFIPLFEKNGFITKLDQYVWDQVCSDLRNWIDQGLMVVPISVNASRRDFIVQDDMNNLLLSVKKYKIKPELLHLEVTETLCLDNHDEIIPKIHAARKQGFSIEMDDFGSGFSSLGMLNRMPIDIIKLDMSFVQNLNAQVNIVDAIISLSHRKGLTVIAEGVETKEQAAILKDMGCDDIQGYLFSKPLPKDEYVKYVKKEMKKKK